MVTDVMKTGSGFARKLHSFNAAEWIAWVILALWAAFWLFFTIASAFGELAELGLGAFLGHLVQALIVVVVLWLCWRWPVLGALVFLGLGALMFYYLSWNGITMALFRELPPLAIGVLLLLGALLHRSPQSTTG